MSKLVFKASGYVMNTTTKNFDLLNRLSSLNFGAVGTGLTVESSYVYNSANQRTRKREADGSYWAYGYDSLGQVISGKRFWDDGTAVAGQEFEYAFDDIGNRNSTKAGGDAGGGSLRTANYTNNSLNQITSRDVPGAVDLIGAAHLGATVTVNGQAAYRYGEYFQSAIPTNNTSTEVYLAVTNIASLGGTNQTNIGYLFIPKTAEVFAYDADGNLTNDGRWSFAWDAENRLTNMTSKSSAPAASKYKLDFKYDTLGRRVQKVVSTNNGSSYFGLYTNKFVYDAWNLAAILDGQNSILYSFQWGTDASGSWQGAGGVGGLISMRVHTGTLAGTYFYCYDGNYNVVALISAASGAVVVQYEYGPFGEVIRATGPLAFLNPFRFSTKYQDDETGFVYYGYRYYNPSAGRWLNRDPLGEEGGLSLYCLLENTSLNAIDLLGSQSTIGAGYGTMPVAVSKNLGPPRPPGNNVVTLPVPDPALPDNGFLGDNLRYVSEHASDNDLIYISIRDPGTFNRRLKRVCGCISRLTVTGHGGGGSQVFGPGAITPRDRTLTVVYPPRRQLPAVQNIEIFDGINFCKPCAIVLAGCDVASGPDWQLLFKLIASKTGCSVWGYTGLGTCPKNGFTSGPQSGGHWEVAYPPQ